MAGLTPGECFNLSAPEFALVPCQQPHEDEAYYRYTLPTGPFPGDQRVQDTTMPTCNAQLSNYVLSDTMSSGEFFDWPITPDQSEWAAGDRVAICVLTRMDMKQITGSAHQAH
jgi:hypothetical protein